MSAIKTYLITYPFKGERYSAEIIAENWGEAEDRLRALQYGKVDGEIVLKIPVSPHGIWQRLKQAFAK